MTTVRARVITPRTTDPVPSPGRPGARTPEGGRRSVRGALVLERRIAGVLALNAIIAVALLWRLLPAPWGGLVPVVLLAQVTWWRHGAPATVLGLLVGGLLGAAAGIALGLGDARRSALALLLVVLPAIAAWPRRDSARR